MPRKLIQKHFASQQAVQRYIDSTPRVWSYKCSETTAPSKSWDLNTSWDGAVALARDGWREGGKAFATGLASLPAMEAAPDWTLDVAGFFPDVPRYLTGRPDCMWSHAENAEVMRRPVLSLCVSIAANCNISAESMTNYGMAIAHYVDELEAGGVQVELLAAIPEQYANHDVCFTWIVKQADERMNLETVAFSIGHPACFRRIGFALIERLDIPPEYGYGVSQSLKAFHLAGTDYADAIRLNGMINANSHSMTRAGAYEHVQREIEAARDAALA